MTIDRRAMLGATCAALAGGAALNVAIIAAKADTHAQLEHEIPRAANLSPQGEKSDPIFAAIERHRAAYDAIEAQDDWDQDDLDEAVAAVTAGYDDLRLNGSPTTTAGWAALLRYVVRREDDLGDVTEQLCAFADRVADALDRMGAQS